MAGSCENLAIIEKPLCSLVIEQNLSLEFSLPSVSDQRSCSEVAFSLFESKVDPTNALNGCLNLSKVNNTGCMSSGEVTDYVEAVTVDKDGLLAEGQNVRDLMLEEMPASVCRISRECLNEIQSQDDACNLETGALCSENRRSQGEYDHNTPLESLQMTVSLGNCVQPDKFDDKSASSLSPEGVEEVSDENSGAIVGLETDTRNQISSLQCCEVPLELITMTGLPSNYGQQQEQENIKSTGDLSLEVVDGKSDYSMGREADVHNLISPLEGGEMPLKVLHTGDLLSNYEQSDQKDDKIVHSLSEEQANRILQTKTNLDTCAHILTSQGCQRALENVHMSESLNIPAQKNEWQNGNDVDGTCAERISKLVEEKSDITTVTSVEPSAANVAHNYTFEKSVSPESCQHFSIANSNTSKDMPDENIITSINSSSVAECSEHTDNEEKDNVGVGCVYEIKCPEIVSSSSRSNGRRSKSSQKTSKKRAEKKCKNTTHVLHSHGSIRIVSKAARMKRSSFSKPARSSIWGSLENITQFFEQSNGIYRVSQLQNQGGRKARGGRRSGKQAKMRASGSSRGSRGNHCVSSGCVRLKVKIGKVAGQSCLNNMDPKVVDASASANTTISDCGTDLFSAAGLELPKFNNGVEDSSREDGQLTNKDTENTNNIGKAAGDADDYLGVPSNVVVDTLGGAIENRCTDSGTSPDSEVINLTPDNQVSAIQEADFNDALLTSSKDVSARGHHPSTKRGKKNKLPRSRNCILKDGSPDPVSISKAKPSKKQGCIPLVGDGVCSREILTSLTNVNSSSNSSSNKELPMEPLVFSRETEHGILRETLKGESSVEAKTYSNLCADVELSESHNSKILHPSMKAMGRKHPKSGKVSKGRSKASESEGKRGNSRRQKREKQSRSVNKCKVKEKDACNQIVHKVESHPETGSHDVDGIEKINADDSTAVTDESNLNMVPGGLENRYPPPRKAWVLCDECHKWRRIPAMLADLIDKTNCTWTCKENMDIAFADCSIPQEKSNAEINVELDISDASGEEDVNDARLNYKASECKRSTGYQESTFKCTSNNEFLHRKRKTQTIDEIMVCHCKPASNDQLGCGDECLNRMLNIECVQGTCPCGDLCSNQQFQKQKYARLEWFRSGKKGYGLKLLEDISKGHFLIEYVGEVLDMHAYEARQKEYALKGHRHFYFMTLNGSEVIDACAKGNLGRFINHSCDPNCRTEKWMVNGEICIGLFALRDIKKGEEVTFDYNYVRVFGAAAKKCYCGAPQCRGYIGGDLLNSEVIVQGDSDEEFPEPVMLLKDGGRGDSMDDMMPKARPFSCAKIQTAKSTLKSRHGIEKCTTGGRHLESTIGKEDAINQSAASYLHSLLELEDSKSRLPSLEVEISHQTDDVTSKSLPAVRQETSIEEEATNKTSSNANRLETVSPTLAHSKSLSDVTNASMNSKSDTVEDKRVSSKSQSQMRVSRSSSSVKKGKASCNPLNTSKVKVTANKSQSLLSKPKRSLASSPNGRSEAVEEKLNELLDTEGGISKRKDAPKGYLKLLFLTAASGDSGNGEAIQSNRDLSMILDALLKTKSRAVLIDIINKNGLQMLHNIMKQYRSDFKKIPILRKLLKVLEYLAVREILTAEHINGGPPCPGKESFRESILSLTEHDDKQVHQIARNFRDRWIPRPFRKLSYVDRDDDRMEIRRGSNCERFSLSHNYWRDQEHARPTEAIDCVKQSMVAVASYDTGIPEGCSAPCIGNCLTSETKTRKRKSRWDQPAETNQDTRSQHKEQKIDCTSLHKIESGPLQRGVEEAQDPIDMVSRKRGNCAGPVHNHSQQDGAISADNERQNIPEDIPPGFSSPQALGLSHASSAATDRPQHNVCDMKCPLDAIIGQPQGKFISRLPVSYGVPLSIIQHFGTPQAESINGWFIAPGMPFHPFPPLPPYPRDSKNCPPSHAPNPMTINQPAEGRRDTIHCRAPCHMDETPKYLDGPCANSNQPYKRGRESSYDLGKRYFRQEKWNATKVRPPWLWKRNAWGHMGDNSRGVSCSIEFQSS
ncbi:histone-lysine N-methyltransferase ASHH2-like isoform X2 [Juglans microcarpa x Juglans regia]|uniref:histone-lysine N-methyltransferase ASHH2-like isoform X2 n=1 Tax=Juglans microcarpa x Juglans regia TaxID=2249226 RepID=UPI001B7DF7E6|nr:histone-lysine N-methyltransferase ASHH2-like isoform X2 [Juglans microcarpa x Juglans regia]